MAAYLEACLDEAGSDAAFIAKALGDIARAKGMTSCDTHRRSSNAHGCGTTRSNRNAQRDYQ